MDIIHTIEMALPLLRELLTYVTSQDGGERECTFSQRALTFINKAILILEQMGDGTRRQCNETLNGILSAAWLVARNLYSAAFFKAVRRVTGDIKDLFKGQIPDYLTSSYEKLRKLLDATSVKVDNIQSTRDELLEKVRFPMTLRRLKV